MTPDHGPWLAVDGRLQGTNRSAEPYPIDQAQEKCSAVAISIDVVHPEDKDPKGRDNHTERPPAQHGVDPPSNAVPGLTARLRRLAHNSSTRSFGANESTMKQTPPEKRAHAAVLAFIAGYVDANTWMRFETFGGAPCVAIGVRLST